MNNKGDERKKKEREPTQSRRQLLASVAGTAGIGALAGCPKNVTTQSFQATPVVLTQPGQEAMGLTEFELVKDTQTQSLADIGEVSVTSYLGVHSRPAEGEPPMRFGEPDPRFRRFGVLSIPSPEVVGDVVSPFIDEPLLELVAGDRGLDLLVRTGILNGTDGEWKTGPHEIGSADVEALGQETNARRFMGIVTRPEGEPMTLVMTLMRMTYEANTVIAGEFVRRLPPPDPIQTDVGCVDDLCQMITPTQVDMWRRFKRAGRYIATCTELGAGMKSVTVCGGSGTAAGPQVKFELSNLRLVQQVEESVVKAPGSSPTHTEPAPDLIEGEPTTVLFEFDTIKNLSEMSDPLEIDITHGDYMASNRSFETFTLSPQDMKDIKNGEDVISVLHNNANDSDSNNDLPVFELTGNAFIRVNGSSFSSNMFFHDISPNPVDLRPLYVGFIGLQDEDTGGRYGTSNGTPRNYRRSVESSAEYLRRAYPGTIVTYGHTDHWVVGKDEVSKKTNIFGKTTRPACDDNCVVYRDMKRADQVMATLVSLAPPRGQGFPKGGFLNTDGLKRSDVVSHVKNNGFDIIVAIVPGNDPSNSGATGYYNFHNINASGLAYGDPAAAVSTVGATASGGDQRISVTAAQEVGHYFQQNYRGPSGDPMAQRRNLPNNNNQPTVNGKPLDPAHARNQNSNRVSGGDAPGVLTRAYDLKGGFDNLQSFSNGGGSFSVTGPSSGSTSVGRSPSYMSYTGFNQRAWGDARIHQELIDSGWSPGGTSGNGQPSPMLSAIGSVAEDGSINYDEVIAFDGVAEYPDTDDGEVTVELVDPDGETLQTAQVPVRIQRSHHGDFVGPASRVPTFRLPFDVTGVEVLTLHGDSESSMNPVVRVVSSAVRRVPEAGFRRDRSTGIEAIDDPLLDVADAMAADDYGSAATTMDQNVRARVEEELQAYEGPLGQPSRERLLGTVDDMATRLSELSG